MTIAKRRLLNKRSRDWDKSHPGKKLFFTQKWHKKNPYKRLEYHIKHKLKIELSIKDLKMLEKKQKRMCMICKTKIKKQRLCIDHDHKTRKVRGLLCQHCNSGLGFFHDKIELLDKAKKYLCKN